MTVIPKRPAWTIRTLYGTVYASEQAFEHAHGVATVASEALKRLLLVRFSEDTVEVEAAYRAASDALAAITASGWRWQ